MRIVDTTRVGRFEPGPGELAGKGDGVGERAACNSRIDGGDE